MQINSLIQRQVWKEEKTDEKALDTYPQAVLSISLEVSLGFLSVLQSVTLLPITTTSEVNVNPKTVLSEAASHS